MVLNIHLRIVNHLVVADALHLDIRVNKQELFYFIWLDYFAFTLFEFFSPASHLLQF